MISVSTTLTAVNPVVNSISSPDRQEQQQQQWQQVGIRTNKTRTASNKFRQLLDQHFSTPSLHNNPFFPLSKMSNPSVNMNDNDNSLNIVKQPTDGTITPERKRTKNVQSNMKSFYTLRSPVRTGKGRGDSHGGRMMGRGGGRGGRGGGCHRIWNMNHNEDIANTTMETTTDKDIRIPHPKGWEALIQKNLAANSSPQANKESMEAAKMIITVDNTAINVSESLTGDLTSPTFQECCRTAYSDMIYRKDIEQDNSNNAITRKTGDRNNNTNAVVSSLPQDVFDIWSIPETDLDQIYNNTYHLDSSKNDNSRSIPCTSRNTEPIVFGGTISIQEDNHVYEKMASTWNKGTQSIRKNKRTRYHHVKTHHFLIGGNDPQPRGTVGNDAQVNNSNTCDNNIAHAVPCMNMQDHNTDNINTAASFNHIATPSDFCDLIKGRSTQRKVSFYDEGRSATIIANDDIKNLQPIALMGASHAQISSPISDMGVVSKDIVGNKVNYSSIRNNEVRILDEIIETTEEVHQVGNQVDHRESNNVADTSMEDTSTDTIFAELSTHHLIVNPIGASIFTHEHDEQGTGGSTNVEVLQATGSDTPSTSPSQILPKHRRNRNRSKRVTQHNQTNRTTEAEAQSAVTMDISCDASNGENQDDLIFATEYTSNWSFEYHPTEYVSSYCITSIIGTLITNIRKVDNTAFIKSWDDSNSSRIWSPATTPPNAEAMGSYVEDPHISKAGSFGRLYGRICVVTNILLSNIKNDLSFSRWLRAYGIFIDLSEIPCTRPKLLGFFNKKMPHGTRIDLFQGYLDTVVKLSRPYQIFSQTIYAGDGSKVQCYAYVLKADPTDSVTLLQELSVLQDMNGVTFYPWDTFKYKMTKIDKYKILNELTDFARGHASFVFSGVFANDYMRLKNHVDVDSLISVIQTEKDAVAAQLDQTLSQVRCLEFMKQHFVASDKEQIFTSIDGPYGNCIEVTFKKGYFSKVQSIEQQFISIISSRMTELSVQKCFRATSSIVVSPSVSRLSNLGRQTHVGRYPRSYRQATSQGLRQIDIPMNLVVTTKPVKDTENTNGTANTTVTSTSITTTPSLWTEMQAAQQQYQTKHDSEIAELRQSLVQAANEARAAMQSVHSLGLDVNAKYNDMQEVLQLSHRQSERLTFNIEHQTRMQSIQNDRTNKILDDIVTKLGVKASLVMTTSPPDKLVQQSPVLLSTAQHHIDTFMHNIQTSTISSSLRTNHPLETNNNSIMNQHHRATERVAESVQ